MKKTSNFNLNRIFQIVLTALIIYCILSICRSLCLLYIAYTDDYFYNFDFAVKQSYIQKSVVFNNAYYFCTYVIGFILSFLLKKVLKLNWLNFIFSLVIGFVLFRFIDSALIRPIFGFFDNPRINIFTHLITFSILVLLFVRSFLKQSSELPRSRPDPFGW
jgi:hypothetical protein